MQILGVCHILQAARGKQPSAYTAIPGCEETGRDPTGGTTHVDAMQLTDNFHFRCAIHQAARARLAAELRVEECEPPCMLVLKETSVPQVKKELQKVCSRTVHPIDNAA